MSCLYCQQDNAAGALVCSACSRDIAVPASLLAERDHLLGKRDSIRDELLRTRAQLDLIRPPKSGIST